MKRRQFFKLAAVAAVAPFLPKIVLAENKRSPYGDADSIQQYCDEQMRAASEDFERAVKTSGAGVLDTVTATSRDETLLVGNSDIFYPGQRIEIFSADLSVKRGSRKVKDKKGSRITLDSRVPGDTAPGDLVLLPDTTNIPYFQNNSKTGTFQGLARR